MDCNTYEKAGPEFTQTEPGQPRQKLRVLVVEDAHLLRDVLRTCLEHDGFEVDTAANGADALVYFHPDRYWVVITDFRMPGMNGLELARAIKGKSDKQPVLMVSGSETCLEWRPEDRATINGLLPKPFTTAEFRDALEAAAGR